MKDLIKIESTPIGDASVPTVNARELHEFLGNGDKYTTWIKDRIEKYDFVENQDFCSFLSESSGGRPSKEYHISLDMAKGLAMVERNEKGKEARRYFIECEKKQAQALKELSFISYTHPEGLIFSVAGELHTTSQVLAKVSGKKHYHILRDIEEEILDLEANPSLDWLIKDRILKGFKETTYKDAQGKARTAYQLSEEAFLQMSLRYSSEVRARFVVAFTSYRDTIVSLYKARVLEKVIPQISVSRSFIYIIREEGKGRLKIGISNNPEKRLKTLQTGSAEDLTLLYTSLVCSNSLEIEANVHEHFKEYLVRGEWFSSELEPIKIIKYLESQTYVLESNFDLSFGSKLLSLIEEQPKDTN